MTRRKISALKEFDAADYLGSEAACAVYLSEIIKEGDTELFLSALGDVARVRASPCQIIAKSNEHGDISAFGRQVGMTAGHGASNTSFLPAQSRQKCIT